MNKTILGLGLGAGVMLAAGTAQAASCSEAAGSIQQNVRAGEPVMAGVPQPTIPSLGGALAMSDTAATVADTTRTDVGTDSGTYGERTANAVEALEQAQIYGVLGQEDACVIALHQALGLLGQT